MSVHRGLFNTRDRAEHTRKRKIVSHTFSAKSVREFEPYIAGTLRTLLSKWDALCDGAKKTGGVGKGWAAIELLDWMNALAFESVPSLSSLEFELTKSISQCDRRPRVWIYLWHARTRRC